MRNGMRGNTKGAKMAAERHLNSLLCRLVTAATTAESISARPRFCCRPLRQFIRN